MLNVIWPIFIIISVIYAFLCGNIENVSNGIFSSLNDVIDLSLTLLGTMCLWNGIMEIARNTSFVDRLCKMLNPLIKILFPRLENEKAKREFLGGRFAVKEAYIKACGPASLKEICCLNDQQGCPYLLNRNGYVSISHENNYAVAFVVVEE